MTVAVIAITLALPAALYSAIGNVTRLTSGWEAAGRISLFLKEGVSVKETEQLAARLRREAGVARVEVITPEQALEEFRRHSGFGDALKALRRNPLPAVLVIHPAPTHQAPEALATLGKALTRHEDVGHAQVDLEWVQRLHAWLGVAGRAVWLLAGLLATAVLLIVGNTIRLSVLNRRDEIAVIKLVGGTDAFIRRPFLYAGLLQGLAGGLAAWGLVELTFLALQGPIGELSLLYRSSFSLQGLSADEGLIVLAAAGLLGWLGSRLAVGRHLRTIEPR